MKTIEPLNQNIEKDPNPTFADKNTQEAVKSVYNTPVNTVFSQNMPEIKQEVLLLERQRLRKMIRNEVQRAKDIYIRKFIFRLSIAILFGLASPYYFLILLIFVFITPFQYAKTKNRIINEYKNDDDPEY